MSSGNYRKASDCLNCGHHVEEHFCTRCGQENIEIKEDAIHMISHAVADYFHFDSKFFGTITPLLVKPGYLTKVYVAGKRVAFIHPIRLYIFISIVFFLFMLSSSKSSHEEGKAPAKRSNVTKKTPTPADLKIERLKKDLSDPKLTPLQRDSLIQVVVADFAKGDPKENDFTINSKWLDHKDTSLTAYEHRQKMLPAKERDNFLKHYIVRKNFELRKYPNVGEKIKEDIKHNVPKMMFILLPLFALILKLVYFRSKKYYYEHLIYSFHVHSALFLSLLLLSALTWFFNLFYSISDLLSFAWFIYALWYIYRSLRTFYGSRRSVTIAKFAFLMFGYLMVFSLCSIIVIAITMVML
jgi:hypothetical protein